jgi:DNA-binding FrmR family transcriptional regulator
MLSIQGREDLIQRLRKIEGQTQGIQRMLVDGRDCREILNQLSSVRAATQQVSLELVRYYLTACLNEPDCTDSETTVDDMIHFLARL